MNRSKAIMKLAILLTVAGQMEAEMEEKQVADAVLAEAAKVQRRHKTQRRRNRLKADVMERLRSQK